MQQDIFNYKEEKLSNKTGYKYWLFESGKPLSFKQVIHLWQTSEVFNAFYSQILEEAPFGAYFWEHPPNLSTTIDQTYEFVLIESKGLNRIKQNVRSFKRFVLTEQLATSFDNLGRNARLIAPSSKSAQTDYSSLAKFIRSAPTEQIQYFWTLVGSEYEQALGDSWKWLSTSGLGVSWLHVRIDQVPKYYVYFDYRETGGL